MTKRPNPKNYMYMALGAVAIGGALCYFQFGKLGESQLRVAKLKAEATDPKAVQARLDDAQKKLADAQSGLKHLEANVSSVAYVPSMLRDLDAFGKANGIAVTGVRPKARNLTPDEVKANLNKPYDELVIQVTGHGTFQNTQKFLNNLTNFPKIVAARTLTLAPSANPLKPGEQPTHDLDITLELKAYVFKDGDGSTSPVAPNATPGATSGVNAATPQAGTTTPPSAPGPASKPTTGQQPGTAVPSDPNTVSPASVPGKTALRFPPKRPVKLGGRSPIEG